MLKFLCFAHLTNIIFPNHLPSRNAWKVISSAEMLATICICTTFNYKWKNEVFLLQNVVFFITAVVAWVIPDVSSKLKAVMIREVTLANEIILKAELRRKGNRPTVNLTDVCHKVRRRSPAKTARTEETETVAWDAGNWLAIDFELQDDQLNRAPVGCYIQNLSIDNWDWIHSKTLFPNDVWQCQSCDWLSFLWRSLVGFFQNSVSRLLVCVCFEPLNVFWL